VIIDGNLVFFVTCKEPNGKQYTTEIKERVLYDDNDKFIDTMTREAFYYARQLEKKVKGREFISLNLSEFQFFDGARYTEKKCKAYLKEEKATN